MYSQRHQLIDKPIKMSKMHFHRLTSLVAKRKKMKVLMERNWSTQMVESASNCLLRSGRHVDVVIINAEITRVLISTVSSRKLTCSRSLRLTLGKHQRRRKLHRPNVASRRRLMKVERTWVVKLITSALIQIQMSSRSNCSRSTKVTCLPKGPLLSPRSHLSCISREVTT